jgi:hypothetical protein
MNVLNPIVRAALVWINFGVRSRSAIRRSRPM